MRWILLLLILPFFIVGCSDDDDDDGDTSQLDLAFVEQTNQATIITVEKNAKQRAGRAQSLAMTFNDDGTSWSTGLFIGTSTFGSGEANETSLTSNTNNATLFLAKYDVDGNLIVAKQTLNDEECVGFTVASTSNGGAWVAGEFGQSATFGPGEANQTIITNANNNEAFFIAKYNPDGTLAFAKRALSSDTHKSFGITVLSDDSALVTGTILGTVTFAPGEANQTIINASNFGQQLFIAKYNVDGSFAFAKIGGLSVVASAIDSFADGSSLVTGRLNGGAGAQTFGAGEANETTFDIGQNSTMFIAKFNADGTFNSIILAINNDITTSLEGESISIGPDNSFVVTGRFQGEPIFGSGEQNQTTLSAGNVTENIFFAKYNSNGTLAFAKQLVANGMRLAVRSRITVNDNGEFFLTGLVIEGGVIFAAGEANETSIQIDSFGIFIAKYEPNGTLLEVKPVTATVGVGPGGIASASNNVIFSGDFAGTMIFEEGEEDQTTLTSSDFSVFVAKYE